MPPHPPKRSRRGRYRRPEPTDPELLRDRAKSHILRKDWQKAIDCLDATLVEPDSHPVGERFVANKHSLVIRGRVRLILNKKSEALADALSALEGLEDVHSPMYTRALVLRADALYQMGAFEHALVFYHRGNRIKEGTNEQFRLGIQKATEAIQNCLKNVRPKMKVDVQIDDTSRMADRQTVTQTSYVFPTEALRPPRQRKKKERAEPGKGFCTVTSKPFQTDIRELKKIMRQLKKEEGKVAGGGRRVEALTRDALSYVSERNSLWIEQDVKRDLKNLSACKFDPERFSYLE